MVGLPLVDEGNYTGLASRVATVHWSWSICVKTGTHTNMVNMTHHLKQSHSLTCCVRSLTPLFTADSVAKTGTDHLLGPLALNPALADEVRQSRICPTGSLLGNLGHSGRLVDRRLDVSDHARAGA